MKLVLIGPVYPYRGGISLHTSMLAAALERDGHGLHVISFKRQYPVWLYPGRTDKDPSQMPVKVPARFTLDPILPWTWRETVNQVLNLKPDAVLLQWWTTFWGPAYWYLCRRLRREMIPRVFLVHNVLPHEPQLWDAWLARVVLGEGSAYLVQADHEKQRLLSMLPNARVTMSPLPIFDMFSNLRVPKEQARAQLNLPLVTPIVLFFGIVRQYKGLHLLVEALARLADRKETIHLLIAGEIWENKSDLINLIHQRGLSSTVTIHDRYILNEEIGLYFSAVDLLAAPYTGGTQSGALKLALGFNLPAVISEHLADESVASQTNVRVIPAGDIELLAEAIHTALHSPPQKAGSTYPIATFDDLARNLDNLAQQLTSD